MYGTCTTYCNLAMVSTITSSIVALKVLLAKPDLHVWRKTVNHVRREGLCCSMLAEPVARSV